MDSTPGDSRSKSVEYLSSLIDIFLFIHIHRLKGNQKLAQ